MRFLLVLLLLSYYAENSKLEYSGNTKTQAKSRHIPLHVSARVDTSNSDIREVLELYENYMNSTPEIISDNPFWNTVEKQKYRDFDFSRSSMYNGITSAQLLRLYTPFVLSIEPQNEKYQIRVLYSNSATESPYIGSKVWCIHKLNAIQEDGVWKLENLLVEETRGWQKKQIDFIEYVFPHNHQFNSKRAQEALAFCEDIINRFHPEFDKTFMFYLASGVDEMGLLENFDYVFSGVTTGKAREGMILSSKGNEFYPHELVHKLLPINSNRGIVIEEGIATFLGTKENKREYSAIMQKLARDFNQKESYTLENILNNQVNWNGYPVAYPAGALVCELIYELKGDNGINQLARGRTNDYNEIMSLLQDILALSHHEIVALIAIKIKEFQ